MKFNISNKFFVISFVTFIILVILGFLATLFIVAKSDDEISTDDEFKLILNLKSDLTFTVKRDMDNDGNIENVYFEILRDGVQIQKVNLGTDFTEFDYDEKKSNKQVILKGTTHSIEFLIVTDTDDYVEISVSRTLARNEKVMDCFLLDSTNRHWYGGPEQKKQYWPINEMKFINNDYLSKELDSAGISERYWLNSKGLFVFVSDRVPLFTHQNSDVSKDALCLEAKKELPFYTHDEKSFKFDYTIGIASNARLAHMRAVNRFFKKPTGYPDERMIKKPIWSTWVRYGRDIDSGIIRDFAEQITANGFDHAQIDIDDLWESCYGSMLLHEKFLDFKELTSDLRSKGFRSTIWIHPFINNTCQPYYDNAITNKIVIQNHTGSYNTKWWNSDYLDVAAYIDFSVPAGRNHFINGLKALKEATGVDSFKFDAGETSWSPIDPILEGDTDFYPSQLTIGFLDAIKAIEGEASGSLTEIRVGQGTQNLPYFVRMLDLDSRWDFENGLPTMVPTLLQMNFNGYVFVLPDMIGGNNYNDDTITKELFVRWMQATALMPAMQFSFTPWDFDQETIDLGIEFTQLHDLLSEFTITRFKLAMETGEPVNLPIWWIDPEDEIALVIGDEFLVGEDILVAPVVILHQRSRDVYLPKGKWKDGNSATIHDGPIWVRNYAAPLNVLPYFMRVV